MGLFDFFRKKNKQEGAQEVFQVEESITMNEVPNIMYQPTPQVSIDEIPYQEMEPSKANCPGIISTPIPNKSRAYANPRHVRFTSLVMEFFKKNV